MEPMSVFEDPTKFVNDGISLKKRLDQDSYIFIRGLLPKQTILNTRSRLLDKAALGRWPDPAYRVDEGIANLSASCKDLEEQYMRVFRNLWKDEELHQT